MEQRVSESSDLGFRFEEIVLDYNSLSAEFERDNRTLLNNVRNPVVALRGIRTPSVIIDTWLEPPGFSQVKAGAGNLAGAVLEVL